MSVLCQQRIIVEKGTIIMVLIDLLGPITIQMLIAFGNSKPTPEDKDETWFLMTRSEKKNKVGPDKGLFTKQLGNISLIVFLPT